MGGIFIPRFLVQFGVRAQEGETRLGDKLLAAVPFVAPAFAAEVTAKAVRVICPVGQFTRRTRSRARGRNSRHSIPPRRSRCAPGGGPCGRAPLGPQFRVDYVSRQG